MNIWCRLVQQECTTWNLLQKSIINPRLLVEVQLNGFDCNSIPLSLTGTWVVIHRNPGKRGTWGLQGDKVWYIGVVPYHYYC